MTAAYLGYGREGKFQRELRRLASKLLLLFIRLAFGGVGWPRVLGDQGVHVCDLKM
jgi:hypothetical protein